MGIVSSFFETSKGPPNKNRVDFLAPLCAVFLNMLYALCWIDTVRVDCFHSGRMAQNFGE